MTVLITLITAGADTGPFDLYSNLDGYITPFETDVDKTSFTSGYSSILVPDYTTIIRIQSKGSCINYYDVILENTTTTTTTIPVIECNEDINSGNEGVTEYTFNLDSSGGLLVLEFNAQSVPDKLEILHNGIKKATSGMTVPNEGPFDDLYGSPTIPSGAEANSTDQFIGSSKGTIPDRQATFTSETSSSITIEGGYQQLIWWEYLNSDYITNSQATVRITGPSGTAWNVKRLCEETTTTTTTLISECIQYSASTYSAFIQSVTFTDCNNNSQEIFIGGTSEEDGQIFCAIQGSVNHGTEVFLLEDGGCSTTTTTTIS